MTDVMRGGFLRDDASGALVALGPNGAAIGGGGSGYRTLLQQGGTLGAALSANNYFFSSAGLASNSGGNLNGTQGNGPLWIPINAVDYADVSTLRVDVALFTTVVQTGVTFTAGLYPVSPGGTGTAISIAMGAVVPGSTAALAAPAAGSKLHATSGDFARPADDLYMLGVNINAATAASSLTGLSLFLRGK